MGPNRGVPHFGKIQRRGEKPPSNPTTIKEYERVLT